MHKVVSMVLTAAAILVVPAGAQNLQRRAVISGNGNPNEGKCTIEVVVDGAADVEIRGDSATLRNLSGQPPQWRRFECTGRMPDNPAQFRARGIDGRGRVQLMQDPRNGGPAVVRIEDPSGGREGYTFDIEWGGGGFNNGPGGRYDNGPGAPRNDNGPGGRYDNGPGAPPYVERDRINGGRFTTERAVRDCESAVRQQAAERFGTDIDFRGTRIDDNPGRRDWVIGTFSARRRGPDDVHQFACSVDFDNGRVRSVEIDRGRGPSRSSVRDSVDICRGAVDEKIRRSGYDRVSIGNIRIDDRPGRNDWVIGDARADRGRRSDPFEFSCRVNLDNGNVRSVDVRRR